MTDQPTTSENSTTRRTALQCAALAGTAGLGLAACSPSSSGSGSASSAGSTASSGGVDLGAASQIPVGGGKVFPSDQVVVTQPTHGIYKAFSAVCTHAGCAVGGVQNGVISCPCHGSQFDAGTGAVVQGPATSPLPSVGLKVQGGKLVATPSS